MTTTAARLAPLALLALLACDDKTNDTADPTDGGAQDGGGTADGGSAGDGGSNVTVTISGQALHMPDFTPPVSTGTACFVSGTAAEICGDFDDDGYYTIENVPANTQGAVRYQGDTIATFAWVLATEEKDLSLGLGIDTPEVVQGYYDQTGVSRDGAGAVVLAEILPPKSGYVSVLDRSGGVDPYYYGQSNGTIDLEREQTSVMIALAVYLNVDRDGGPYATSFTSDDGSCATSGVGGAVDPWAILADADIMYTQFRCP